MASREKPFLAVCTTFGGKYTSKTQKISIKSAEIRRIAADFCKNQ
jgi:hypothetical protein